MISLIIADDHSIVRKGLKQIINESFSETIITEVSDSDSVMNTLEKVNCDIIILDLSMPGKNGIELIKDIKVSYPSLPILVLSMYPEDQFAVRVLKAGASCYMNKESTPDELVSAMKELLKGGKYINSTIAVSLLKELEEPSALLHENLSDREYEVFLLLAAGNSLTSVAENLNISVKTVGTYKSRIFSKLHITNIAQLIKYALERKLIL